MDQVIELPLPHLPPSNARINPVGSSHLCMSCVVKLSCVVHAGCGHRHYCFECYRAMKALRRGRRLPCAFTCTVAAADVGEDYDGSRHQLVSVAIDGTDNVDPTLTLDPVTFPYGYCILHEANLVSDDHQEIHKLQTAEFRAVRERSYSVLRGLLVNPDNAHLLNEESRRFVTTGMRQLLGAKLSGKLGEDVFMMMLERLAPADRESIMSEILAKVELSTAVEQHSFLSNQLSIIDLKARALVKHFFVANDMVGCGLRAGFTGAVDGALVGLQQMGRSSVPFGLFGGNCISSVLVFTFLLGMEVFRWCDGDTSTAMMLVNVGEHAIGCGAAIVGGLGGAALGTLICPVIGTIIGGILGGIIADFAARSSYRAGATQATKEAAKVSKKALVEEAAMLFDIMLANDTYPQAKTKYHKVILRNHPDRCPTNASDAEKKEWNTRASNYIAKWNIVRQYYSENKLIAAGTYDAFSIMQVLQTYDNVREVWRSVRTWLNDQAAFPVGLQGPETRVVEYRMYY